MQEGQSKLQQSLMVIFFFLKSRQQTQVNGVARREGGVSATGGRASAVEAKLAWGGMKR